MIIETAQDAIEAYKCHDEWEYADREAAWKWMFEAGQKAEREACAMVADDWQLDDACETYLCSCATAIRERVEKK